MGKAETMKNNLYLRDCTQKGRKLSMDWRASA